MRKCLGLDVGEKTIGVAVSDLLGLTAQGVATIKRTSKEKDFAELAKILDEHGAEVFVIGLPKNMNGTEGERCEFVRNFAKSLAKKFPNVEQIFWDERLSTVAMEKVLIDADISRKKRKKVIDTMAAGFILQGYLDSKRGEF